MAPKLGGCEARGSLSLMVSPSLCGTFGTEARVQHLPVSWTGMTIFLSADGAWPSELPVARSSSVKDPNGAVLLVSPASLLPLETNKKVLQFDVGARNRKDPRDSSHEEDLRFSNDVAAFCQAPSREISAYSGPRARSPGHGGGA